jgi:hypothetical protein
MHGIAFSILYLILAIVWFVALVFLVMVGLFIGLIIGLLVLFWIIGGLNTLLADAVWGMSLRSDWKSLLFHGFALFFVLLIAHIPAFIINLAAQNIVIYAMVFIVYAFIDGFLARSVAEMWEGEEPQYVPEASEEPTETV